MSFKKLNQETMLNWLLPGKVLLDPLVVRSVLVKRESIDARIEVGLPGESAESFVLAVEAKLQNTPLVIQNAVNQVKSALVDTEWPLVLSPYLSPERLTDLARQQVSGVDLCGNGIIIIPRRLYILRTGQPNLYPESRPLNNPYAGRSAMVARFLLTRSSWTTLSWLVPAIEKAGCSISISQVSKALQALSEDLVVSKEKGAIKTTDVRGLLDRLGAAWRKPVILSKQSLRLPAKTEWAKSLAKNADLRWALTGASSVERYTMFGQGGPRKIAVSNLAAAVELTGGIPEAVPNFADIELWETEEPGFYFDNEVDSKGVRWASRLQTWLELQAGDARQREAAQDLREQILSASKV